MVWRHPERGQRYKLVCLLHLSAFLLTHTYENMRIFSHHPSMATKHSQQIDNSCLGAEISAISNLVDNVFGFSPSLLQLLIQMPSC